MSNGSELSTSTPATTRYSQSMANQPRPLSPQSYGQQSPYLPKPDPSPINSTGLWTGQSNHSHSSIGSFQMIDNPTRDGHDQIQQLHTPPHQSLIPSPVVPPLPSSSPSPSAHMPSTPALAQQPYLVSQLDMGVNMDDSPHVLWNQPFGIHLSPPDVPLDFDAATAAALKKREHRISQGSDVSHLTFRSDMSGLSASMLGMYGGAGPMSMNSRPSPSSASHSASNLASAHHTPATSGTSPTSDGSAGHMQNSEYHYQQQQRHVLQPSMSPLPDQQQRDDGDHTVYPEFRTQQPSPKIYACHRCPKEFDQFHKLK